MKKEKQNQKYLDKGELLLFRTLWRNSSDNMFIVRLDENGEFISEASNQAQDENLNLELDRTKPVFLKNVLSKENYQKVIDRYNQCILCNKPLTYEEYVTVDNMTKYYNTTIVPLKDSSGVQRIFGVSRDITLLVKKEQEKLLQEQIKHTQVTESIGTIAHQWRQPLSELNMNNAYISEMTKDKSLQEVLFENERIIQLLSDTITIFENIYKSAQTENFNLLHSVIEVVQILKTSFQRYQIQVNYSIDDTINIRGESGLFYQVLITLLQNAIEIIKEKRCKEPVYSYCRKM